MSPFSAQLRRDALQIWRAGVEAVLPSRLVPQWLRVEGEHLVVGPERIPLNAIRRIVVVGAGKAGASMAEAVEAVFGLDLMEQKQLAGWVNVPSDCVRGYDNGSDKRDSPIFAGAKIGTVPRIHLHAARPAGVNEPTPEGVAGSMEILQLVESLGPEDLCLCLISGGGSALMPAPVKGISLADKLAVTRHLSAAGANIEQLNTVRKQLSRIKGGGLLRACRAGRLVSLILSDVLGDPLDLIASGPTVPDFSTPQDALAVLEHFSSRSAGISSSVFEYLENAASLASTDMATCRLAAAIRSPGEDAGAKRFFNYVIGNNATAVAAASKEAERLGYSVVSEMQGCWGGSSTATPTYQSATYSEGQAEDVGWDLAERALTMRTATGPVCPENLPSPDQPSVGARRGARGEGGSEGRNSNSPDHSSPHPNPLPKGEGTNAGHALISGGEPVVKLVESSRRGLGGRNQQLVLAALNAADRRRSEGYRLALRRNRRRRRTNRRGRSVS